MHTSTQRRTNTHARTLVRAYTRTYKYMHSHTHTYTHTHTHTHTIYIYNIHISGIIDIVCEIMKFFKVNKQRERYCSHRITHSGVICSGRTRGEVRSRWGSEYCCLSSCSGCLLSPGQVRATGGLLTPAGVTKRTVMSFNYSLRSW